MKTVKITRRAMHQTWKHLETALERTWNMRAQARKERHLDDISQLIEAAYHIKKAMAHLHVISKHRFGRRADELEAYK